jgi:hypothetical protein
MSDQLSGLGRKMAGKRIHSRGPKLLEVIE